MKLKVKCLHASTTDQGLIHPSWLLCVYQRMFHSENKSLMREGVCHLLELQVLSQPHFALAFSQVCRPCLSTCFSWILYTQFEFFLIFRFSLLLVLLWKSWLKVRSFRGKNLKLLYVPEINKITTLTLYINHFFSICRSVGQNNVGDCPELGAKLQVFLANFFCSLPSQHRGRVEKKTGGHDLQTGIFVVVLIPFFHWLHLLSFR